MRKTTSFTTDGYPLTKQGVRDLGNTKRTATTVIPPATDGSADLDFRPPFKIVLSQNCGASYEFAGAYDNLADLEAVGRRYDEQMLRWFVEDADGKMVDFSAIHRRIVALVDHLSRGVAA
jgi:hypothetical protein